MDNPEDSAIKHALPCLPKLATLSAASSLQSCIDWSRPLIFNYFVSSGLKQSDLEGEQAAFEMDCVSTALLTYNIFCFASGYGFNGGIDALASVAFGANRPLELHLVLYRQLLLIALLVLVLFTLVSHCRPILLLLGQASDHATRTSELLAHLAWALPGDLSYDCLGRWAKGQQRHQMVSRCTLMALLINLVANNVWRDIAQPILGPVRALVLQNTTLPILVLFSLCHERHRFITAPFGAVIHGISEQLRVCTQCMVWISAEMWAWEVQIFEAARLGAGAAASYAILSSTYSLLIFIPAGVGIALTAMLGEALGSDRYHHGIGLLKLATAMGAVVVFAYSLPLICARTVFAEVLGGGVPAVEAHLTLTLPLILATQLIDGVLNILRSWLLIRKLQGFGAIQSLMCYYGLALPLGWYLAFRRNYGLGGLWLGLAAAVAAITLTSALRIALDIVQQQR